MYKEKREKMEYIDEKILELRKKAKMEEYKNLEQGIYVKEELLEFKRIELFDKKMSIMLPTTFLDMPSSLAKIKYPSEQRPQIIKTNLNTDVNFTFSLYNIPIKSGETKEAAKQFQMTIKKINPANIFYELVEEPLGETFISWFDFKSFAIDECLYNLMYVTPIEGHILHGVFNCFYRDAIEWKDCVHKVLLSIQDFTK